MLIYPQMLQELHRFENFWSGDSTLCDNWSSQHRNQRVQLTKTSLLFFPQGNRSPELHPHSLSALILMTQMKRWARNRYLSSVEKEKLAVWRLITYCQNYSLMTSEASWRCQCFTLWWLRKLAIVDSCS